MHLSPDTIRKNTQEALFEEGLKLPADLPLTPPPGMRRVKRVAQRAVALYALLHAVYGEAKPAMLEKWCKRSGVWPRLLPEEQAFLQTANPKEALLDEMSWRIERLYVYLWAIRRVDDLELPRLSASLEAVDDLPIPLQDVTSWIEDSFYRDEAEIWQQLDIHLACEAVVKKHVRGPVAGDLFPDVALERMAAFREMMAGHEGSSSRDEDNEE